MNRLLLLELLDGEAPKNPKHFTLLPMFFIISQNLMGRSLLLKTPHTWVTEHGEIKLLLACKLHLFRLACVVLEVLRSLLEEKRNYHLFRCGSYELQKHPDWQDVSTVAIVGQMLWEQPTTFWLHMSCSLRWNQNLVPSLCQEPVTTQILDPGREPTTNSLLNGIVKTAPNGQSLHP